MGVDKVKPDCESFFTNEVCASSKRSFTLSTWFIDVKILLFPKVIFINGSYENANAYARAAITISPLKIRLYVL